METQIIKTTGEEIKVEPKNGTDFSLQELQKIVGGYVEIVDISENEYMIVNEEGHLVDLAYNKKATEIFKQSRYSKFYRQHEIVGNVLICKRNQIK
jgi:hypothetical protein